MEGFDEVESCRGVEVVGVVVLRENVGIGSEYFGNGNVFFFVVWNIMDKWVVNNCFVGVFNVEYF